MVYELNRDGGLSASPAEKIVDAVADVTEIDPVALPPLFESIDPDALNRLVSANTEGEIRLTFQYGGFEVVVHRSEIRLRVPDEVAAHAADE